MTAPNMPTFAHYLSAIRLAVSRQWSVQNNREIIDLLSGVQTITEADDANIDDAEWNEFFQLMSEYAHIGLAGLCEADVETIE